MTRRSVYISEDENRHRPPATESGGSPLFAVLEDDTGPPRTPPARRLVAFIKRRKRIIAYLFLLLVAVTSPLLYDALMPAPAEVTQEDIDEAVLYSLDTMDEQPDPAVAAYNAVSESVVRVRRLGADPQDGTELGVGTGVVIVDSGLILTNLHVVAGAERVAVVFADGFETDASVVSITPEQDLAVLQAEVIPEGLRPATLAGTGGLRPGEPVIAIGNPFGIGPSVTRGVISGLGRSYTSMDGEVLLGDLIQFDAAANPGNSGGPLVTMRGEVIGIVTAILNPTQERFFVGIGFAVPIETAAEAVGPNPF